jgi:hypothetical protein
MKYSEYLLDLGTLRGLATANNANVLFLKNRPFGSGIIYDDDNHFAINIMPRCNDVTDMQYIKTIVAFFHEFRHFKQNTDLFQNDSSCKSMAGDKIVANRNKKVYDENHKTFRHEIDAEMNGIMGAYNFLSSKYGDMQAEHMLVQYVNDEMTAKYNVYYIDKHDVDMDNLSLSSILDAFDSVLHSDNHKRLSINIETNNVCNEYSQHGSMMLSRICATSSSDGKSNTDNIYYDNNGYSQLDKMLYIIAACRPDDLKQYKILDAKEICQNDFGLKLSSEAALKHDGRMRQLAELDAIIDYSTHGHGSISYDL